MNLFKGALSFFRKSTFHCKKKKYSSLGNAWRRTYNVYGHEPTFPINCFHCEAKMMLRYTEVFPKRNRPAAISEGLNHMAYKCPRCHKLDKWFIPDDEDYLTELKEKKRDGISLYIPPKEVWEKENEEIKKRLKDLGYM